MMGACLLLLTGEATIPKQAIGLIRTRRCKQAVETRRQEDFVKRYFAWLIETGVMDAPPGALLEAPNAKASVASVGANVEERRAAAELRRQQVKERREAVRASTKVQSGAAASEKEVACSGKMGCSCLDCAASAAMLA